MRRAPGSARPLGRVAPPQAHGRLRLSIVGLVVTALFGALLVRLWALQVVGSSQVESLAATSAVQTIETQGPRGLIEAAQGQPLVSNQTVLVVTLDRQDAEQYSWLVPRVATLVGETPQEVTAALDNVQFSPYAPAPVASGVAESVVVRLEENQSQYPGVSVQLESERTYPEGDLAAQTLGYVSQISAAELTKLKGQGYEAGDAIGDTGVEQADEQWLRGTPGSTKLEVNALGQVIQTLSSTAPKPGNDVILNLNLGLQEAVETDLSNQIQTLRHTVDPSTGQTYPATDGAAVVLDPRNGHILAMASLPTYNPALWVGGISEAHYQALTSPQSNEPLLNRVIDGLYTPGSTFKLATATAALQDGLIDPTSIIDDANGSFTVPNCSGPNCTLHDSPGDLAPGPLTVSQAITASDDVFFYDLGYQFFVDQATYGLDAIQQWAARYGLGELTRVDLPDEATGVVDSAQYEKYLYDHYPKAYPYGATWYVGDNMELAFGQGSTQITPLQLANAYATFANGGTRYQPQVTAAVVSPAGRLVKRVTPVVTGHVALSAQNRAALLAGFEGAVDQPNGTAYATFSGFPLDQLQVAGKTGTATRVGPNGQNLEPTSWFVGFAPANDARYVVAVVISQAGYGASASAVVVRNIFDYLLAHPIEPAKVP